MNNIRIKLYAQEEPSIDFVTASVSFLKKECTRLGKIEIGTGKEMPECQVFFLDNKDEKEERGYNR